MRSLEARLEELRTAADQADAEYREEIARLRLTDAEREILSMASRFFRSRRYHDWADNIDGLLERLGGGR